MDEALVPGDGGRNCPFDGRHRDDEGKLIECACDECDYLQCCTAQHTPERSGESSQR